MSDLLTTPELVSETVKEPAKRWRNWWRANIAFVQRPSGRRIPAGYVGTQIGTYPSREIAEQVAQEYQIAQAMRFGIVCSEYLGAFPEGERP